jgi:hypothetical protein
MKDGMKDILAEDNILITSQLQPIKDDQDASNEPNKLVKHTMKPLSIAQEAEVHYNTFH